MNSELRCPLQELNPNSTWNIKSSKPGWQNQSKHAKSSDNESEYPKLSEELFAPLEEWNDGPEDSIRQINLRPWNSPSTAKEPNPRHQIEELVPSKLLATSLAVGQNNSSTIGTQTRQKKYHNQEQPITPNIDSQALSTQLPSLHHLNYFNAPAPPNTTPPEVSLWLIFTPPKNLRRDTIHLRTILAEALTHIDPIWYEGPSSLLTRLHGSSFQKAVNGRAFKFYKACGTWVFEGLANGGGGVYLDEGPGGPLPSLNGLSFRGSKDVERILEDNVDDVMEDDTLEVKEATRPVHYRRSINRPSSRLSIVQTLTE
ncbi:MAG: hypothetical protein M1834_001599 [Cirrosporium novae-zelandiae]|nr:MAG: hypothetical protein M1834_004116 [Cirrosporium novae-zelandiae]KAI9735583.1 MAG: hypothetical protein M1834_001599 [Cirrosporium novae-zelandiae]